MYNEIVLAVKEQGENDLVFGFDTISNCLFISTACITLT